VTIPFKPIVAQQNGRGSATTTIKDVSVAQLFSEDKESFILLHAKTEKGEGVPPGISCADLRPLAESGGNAIRELADQLVEEAARASEFRVRLELSERAESTLREELAEERRRREEAEREREDLRQELAAVRESRESPEPIEEEPERAEPRPDDSGAQESVQRPWWRRVFRRL
jgi:hypothetical protein